jgi:putative ABC transport system ATP-binding protein
VLEARGIARTYRMGDVEVPALRGIDLEVFEGELVVILGPSGSGKSTLLHILGGLDTASGGTFRYRDHDMTGADDRLLTHYRREHVGFVFQFYNLIPSLTARENVALATDIVPRPMPPQEALEIVGLAARADHFPSQMSGGEQQRVAIARAIAKSPDMLLCDEPTGALDVTTGRVVLAALARINRDLGTTVVIITHNAVLAGMADRVVTMAGGRVARIERNAARVAAEELVW